MKWTRLSGCKKGQCPGFHLTDRGTIAVQGSALTTPGSASLDDHEALVEVPVAVFEEAIRAWRNSR
jgi:hypothetical protein